MATTLPTDYTDATWTGNRKYKMINNSDGTVSFEDVTEYTNKENSFFGASDANAMNAAVNELNTNLTSLTAKTTGSGTLNSTYVSSGKAAYTKFGRLCYMDVHFKYTAAASGTWTGQRLVASGLPKPLFEQYVTNVATDNEKSDSWFIIKTNGDLYHVSRGTDMASKESYMGFLYITAS